MNDYERIVALWRRKNIITDAELALSLRQFKICFACHSCKIDNEDTTYEDTKAVFLRERAYAFRCNLPTLFAIRNSRDAYEVFLKAFGERRLLDERLLCEFQRRLTKFTFDGGRLQAGERPGTFRSFGGPADEPDAGAAADDVRAETAALLERLRHVEPEQLFEEVVRFYAEFMRILPFADGNGLTCRLAVNYLFVLNDHPPAVLIEEDRLVFRDGVEIWVNENRLGPLLDLFHESVIETWQSAGDKNA